MIGERMIGEFDTVALTHAVPGHGLEAGDIGTVVMVHGDGDGFEVEFYWPGKDHRGYSAHRNLTLDAQLGNIQIWWTSDGY